MDGNCLESEHREIRKICTDLSLKSWEEDSGPAKERTRSEGMLYTKGHSQKVSQLQLIFDKRKNIFPVHMLKANWVSTCKRPKLNFYLTP